MLRKKPYMDVARIARALFVSVNSPYSVEKLSLLDNLDWSSIAKSTINPELYDNPYLFGYDYACHYFLKKLSFDNDADRLHKEALQQFLVVESRISQVNHRIRYSSLSSDVEGIISYARRKIEHVLGDFPLAEFLGGCGWGPGATSTLKGSVATRDKKILEESISTTGRCLPIIRAFLTSDMSWMRARIGDSVSGNCSPLASEFHVTEDGRFASVPKDMNRRRSIDIQPTANLFLQKGIGKVIRRRLKCCGIDLDDQTRNQQLAKVAFQRSLCTIDLESASDSVSTELVRLLLPSDWYGWLDSLRTHSISLDGSSHSLSKFSAMGNGFTFELESLIFYALSWGVIRAESCDFESPISVYGDDIIVASKHYKRLSFVLSECGFIINDSKSFFEGPFYESCGKHYFKGFDVTPPIQKEAIDDGPAAVRCANRLWRWALRMGAGLCLDNVASQAFRDASTLAINYHQLRYLRKSIPLPRQPWWLEGDGGLISDTFGWSRYVPGEKTHGATVDIHGTLRLTLYSAFSRKRKGHAAAMLYDTLFVGRMSEQPTYGFVSPRGDVKWITSRRRVSLLLVDSPLWC